MWLRDNFPLLHFSICENIHAQSLHGPCAIRFWILNPFLLAFRFKKDDALELFLLGLSGEQSHAWPFVTKIKAGFK